MRIYNELYFPCDLDLDASFVRIDIGNKEEVADFLAMGNKSKCIPMLFAKARHQDLDSLIELHIDAAKKITSAGFHHLVLAADNDGAWQRSLSPRANAQKIEVRLKPLLSCYEALVALNIELWLAITIEELAPGGFDASDGVFVLQEFERLGLKTAIVSAGSRDFMPLFSRRATQKKAEDFSDFLSNEPSLASTKWAITNTKLNILALAPIDNDKAALALAAHLGLFGLIRRF